MDSEQAIADISNKITELEEQSSTLSQQAWYLRQEKDVLVAALILEKDLLRGTTWDVKTGLSLINSDDVYLSYSGASPTPQMEMLIKLARSDYHSSFTVDDRVSLRFDDSEISIAFKDAKGIMPFVQRHGLIISGSTVQTKLSKLKREVSILETLCHRLGL